MTRLLLVRHGLTDWNIEGRYQGHADIPLNEAGRRMARGVAAGLQSEPLTAIYASDLSRAVETAQIIAALQEGPTPTLDARLREVNFGDWEGMTFAEIEQRHPEVGATWKANLLTFTPPGGESLLQLAVRVQAAYTDIVQSHSDDATIVLVAHGGPLQALVCLALGLPVERYWQFRISQASLTELRLYPEGAILNSLNESHWVERGGRDG
jgi:alpha-ribazole phosphatase